MPPRRVGVATSNEIATSNESPDDGEGPDVVGYVFIALSYLMLAITFPLTIWFCFKVLNEYERAVILRMGRLQGGIRKAGILFVLPCIDEVKLVDIRSFVCEIQPQNILTKDSATVMVNAVVQARIKPQARVIMSINNAPVLVRRKAAAALRNVLGLHTLTEIIGETESISKDIKKELDKKTGGLKLERVDIKDIKIPKDMQRAMAAEAETTRGARAKVIAADGEKQASSYLKEASLSMGHSKVAMNLRYLQALKDMAALKQTTILFPIPMDLQIVKGKKQN